MANFYVDASITHCANVTSTDPAAAKCAQFLADILVICHEALVTPDWRREWEEHRSRFARQWYAAMVSKRKLHEAVVSDQEYSAVKAACLRKLPPDSHAAFEKDWHILQAALVHQCHVASTDSRMLGKLSAIEVDHVGDVTWVNPVSDDGITVWLQQGATGKEYSVSRRKKR